MVDAIEKSVTVPLPPERAFDLFTHEIADWWPLDSHSLSAHDGTPARSVEITPEIGGPVTETKPDGSTAIWGRVTEWTPARAFGMTWHVGRPETEATHVQVTFDVVADGTRVTLVHGGWQALGNQAAMAHASYLGGWDAVFVACYGKACQNILAPA